MKVLTGNPVGEEGQGDSSLQAWVVPAGDGDKEFIGQIYRTVADWNVAEEGKWVENSLTISGDASSLTGTTAPVAGGELVILSSNFDASCCGGGEAGRVYFDNFRVEVDGEQVYAESFENAGVTEGGEGELADAGWVGNADATGLIWPAAGSAPAPGGEEAPLVAGDGNVFAYADDENNTIEVRTGITLGGGQELHLEGSDRKPGWRRGPRGQ